eukprot:11272075-Heterocapsa_arctica.AAC.1
MRRMPGQDLTGIHNVLLNPWNEGIPKHPSLVARLMHPREKRSERDGSGEKQTEEGKGRAPLLSHS